MLWKGFQRPKRLEFERETLTDRFGRFYAQPFERGFGTTIGNALRRVLLSSIEGAAITAVKIDGVLHEFSPIPGVVEDATDIILNLKQIPLKLHVDYTKTLYLRVDKPGIVRAKDIEVDQDVEILEPEAHIATISEGGKLHMELRLKRGRGYVSADKNFDEDLDVGVGLDVARADFTGLVDAEVERFGRVGVQLQRNLLQVEDDVRCVLDHTGNRRELVQYTVDLYCSDCRTLNRGEQHATQRVADRGAEPSFERLGVEPAKSIGESLALELETLRTLKTFPEHGMSFRLWAGSPGLQTCVLRPPASRCRSVSCGPAACELFTVHGWQFTNCPLTVNSEPLTSNTTRRSAAPARAD